ncbi:hypothetical protein BB560_001703 [Smittium megazygosporum]|uniref:DUF676 domain-containing protein n=1 Tax=Smittium megazygosporum TaxID=133381 RepID=A0A2T9ZH20_9FUNG|nr:hypothetical protein BB560_001703 [Smittium megazygosporum]
MNFFTEKSAQPQTDLVLVYVHGFKGSQDSFEDFPEFFESSLTESLPGMKIHSLIYPTYETRRELRLAVEDFSSWLTDSLYDLFLKNASGFKNKNIKIALLGHSMGGLLITDAAMELNPMLSFISAASQIESEKDVNATEKVSSINFTSNSSSDKNISSSSLTREKTNSGSLLGSFFSSLSFNSTKTSDSREKSTQSNSNSVNFPANTNRTGIIAAGLLSAAVGVAVTAYLHRDMVSSGTQYFTEHFCFVSSLYKEAELSQRMTRITSNKTLGFHCYYNVVDPNFNSKAKSNIVATKKTFITLPSTSVIFDNYFTPVKSNLEDEISSHVYMFNVKLSHYVLDLVKLSSSKLLEFLEI